MGLQKKKRKKKRSFLGSGTCTKNQMQCVPEFLEVGNTLRWICTFVLIGVDGYALYDLVFRSVSESKVDQN